MTSRNPSSISTAVCFSLPASKERAASSLRLTSPEVVAASWSASWRSRPSETAIGSPSADSTIAWVTPVTLVAKVLIIQLRLRASALSGGIEAPHGRVPSATVGPLGGLAGRWPWCGPSRTARRAGGRVGGWTAYCGPCWGEMRDSWGRAASRPVVGRPRSSHALAQLGPELLVALRGRAAGREGRDGRTVDGHPLHHRERRDGRGGDVGPLGREAFDDLAVETLAPVDHGEE